MFLDIDECAENSDGCAQNCTDTDGSYTCSCEVGYDLAYDGRGCNGKKKHQLIANYRSIFCMQTLMNVLMVAMDVPSTAPTRLDHTLVAVTQAFS